MGWVSSYERKIKVLPAAKTEHASQGSPTYSIFNGQHVAGPDEEEDEVKRCICHVESTLWTSSSCASYFVERTEHFLANTIWCTLGFID